jgi:hypothetical protein
MQGQPYDDRWWLVVRVIVPVALIAQLFGAYFIIVDAAGLFWPYMGLSAIVWVTLLGAVSYRFGIDAIFASRRDMLDILDDETNPNSLFADGLGLRARSARQVVAEFDQIDRNRPGHPSPVAVGDDD